MTMTMKIHQHFPQNNHDHNDRSNILAVRFFELIASRNWKKVKAVLRGKLMHAPKSTIERCTGCCFRGCKGHHSAMHYAFQFRPPLDVVKLLYKAYPKAISEIDCKGRYPIHIACKHGCDSDIINFLVNKNPTAAKQLDIKKRSPLTLALKSYTRKSNKAWRYANAELMEVVVALTEIEGMPLMIDDYKGTSALEYAVIEELHSDIYSHVQYLIEEEQKRIQKHAMFSRMEEITNEARIEAKINFTAASRALSHIPVLSIKMKAQAA